MALDDDLPEVLVLSVDTLVTVISAGLSLTGALVAGIMANRSARQAHELDRRKRHEEQQEVAERILGQYRDPLLDAANTLQARLFNIVAQRYLERYLHCGNPDEERYARDYTVFAIAEYLCWVEILRRELRFLDLGDVKRNRRLLAHLTRTQVTFQSEKIIGTFRVFRGRQRAIAELMMVPTNAPEGPRSECLGYAQFTRRLDTDPEFVAWFGQLREDVMETERTPPDQRTRAVLLQRDLIDLIDFLDPDEVRLPAQLRKRLPEPADAPEPTPV
jgi:hypothetical protein